jgi:ankyrin repeat protein
MSTELPVKPIFRRSDSLWRAMEHAIAEGDTPEVRLLLDAHPGLLLPDFWYPAVMGGHLETCDLFLRRGLSPDETGAPRTALHFAAMAGSYHICRRLLEAGANVSARDEEGLTALDLLLEKDMESRGPDFVGLFLAHGAPVDAWTAARLGDEGRMAALLSANPALRDALSPVLGVTPLMCAARCGRAAMARYLISQRADVNARSAVSGDDGGNSPLWFAAQSSRSESVAVAQALLDSGADKDAPGEKGWRPLHVAAIWNREAMCRFLVAVGANTTAVDNRRLTALDLASAMESDGARAFLSVVDDAVSDFLYSCWQGSPNEVERSLEHDRYLLQADDSVLGTPPLYFAAYRGRCDNVAVLIAAGADANRAETVTGRSPLHAAALSGQVSCAEALVAASAELDAVDFGWGWTPLAVALNQKAAGDETAAFLQAKGATYDIYCALAAEDVGAISTIAMRGNSALSSRTGYETGGLTPLQYAVGRGSHDLVTALLEAGADVGVISDNGVSALTLALANEDAAIAATLQRFGATSDLSSALWIGDMRTARMALTYQPQKVREGGKFERLIHWMAVNGAVESVNLLLSYGADPETMQVVMSGVPMEMTPLHHVSALGKFRVAETIVALLEFGADVNVRALCHSNPTPLMLAVESRNIEAVRALLNGKPDLRLRDTRRQLTALGWAKSIGADAIVAELQGRGAPE